ncbi:MAG: hypothetical protein DRN15_05535 [Thermoprotei archaeon]|mgnify:CR=1 FL=1|nr:MAG: hypothetical protein DRM97_05450 [Thermoprotei archaeon]RLF23641.1 MAG: hypothetical protein DRN15_05535 [Thermoprotei archaeon]
MEFEVIKRIHGVIPAVFTPFKNDSIWEEVLKEHVEYLIKAGVHGLYVCGSAGMGPLMSYEERVKVLDSVMEVARGKVLIIPQVGSIVMRDVLEFAKYCSKKGVEVLSAITPYYYHRVDYKALIKYYSRIHEVSQLPLMLYNLPSATGINLSPDVVSRMIEELPFIVGIKDSSGNIAQLTEYLMRTEGKEFAVICGSDSIIFPALVIGARGVISGMANVFPELLVELYNACMAKDYDKARKLQFKILRLRSILRRYTHWTTYYEAIKLLGRRFGTVRFPLRESLDKEELEELKRDLGDVLG